MSPVARTVCLLEQAPTDPHLVFFSPFFLFPYFRSRDPLVSFCTVPRRYIHGAHTRTDEISFTLSTQVVTSLFIRFFLLFFSRVHLIRCWSFSFFSLSLCEEIYFWWKLVFIFATWIISCRFRFNRIFFIVRDKY